MKKKIIAVLCMLVVLGGFYKTSVASSAEEAKTYNTQVTDSSGNIYGSYIQTNLYAGCTYGVTVRTPKADVMKMMKITSDEEYKGAEPVLYVGDFSWETKEKKLVDELMDKFGGKLVFLLDMQLFRYDGTANILFNPAPSKLDLMIGIPEKANGVPMWEKDREFAMIRIHDGKAELIRDTDTDTRTISFQTDKFSVYALAYAPAGNIDTYLKNAGLDTPADTGAANAAGTQTQTPAQGSGTSSEYDDVPKTGDIEWEKEYGYSVR